jgi:hypothetical protein
METKELSSHDEKILPPATSGALTNRQKDQRRSLIQQVERQSETLTNRWNKQKCAYRNRFNQQAVQKTAYRQRPKN